MAKHVSCRRFTLSSMQGTTYAMPETRAALEGCLRMRLPQCIRDDINRRLGYCWSTGPDRGGMK